MHKIHFYFLQICIFLFLYVFLFALFSFYLIIYWGGLGFQPAWWQGWAPASLVDGWAGPPARMPLGWAPASLVDGWAAARLLMGWASSLDGLEAHPI